MSMTKNRFYDLINNISKTNSDPVVHIFNATINKFVPESSMEEISAKELYDFCLNNPDEARDYLDLSGINKNLAVNTATLSVQGRNTCTIAADPDTGISNACSTSPGPLNYCNFIQQEHTYAKGIECPTSLFDLYKLVNDAIYNNQKLRAIGNGHSYSDVSMSSGFLIKMSNFTGEENLNQDDSAWNLDWVSSHFEDSDKSNFVSLLAGTSIKDLNILLNNKQKAMSNLGGSDVQTLAGALATGTHGSGFGNGCLADYVRSMVLVTGAGIVIRLEPETKPFTDKTKYQTFKPTFKSSTGAKLNIPLVQSDQLFNAALVAMGSFGIIYSMVLEVEDKYCLFEEREKRSWDEIKRNIKLTDPLFNGKDLRSIEITINPYKNKYKVNSVIVTKRNYKQNGVTPSPNELTKRGHQFDIRKSFICPDIVYALFSLFPFTIPHFLSFTLDAMEDRIGKGEGFLEQSFEVYNSGITEFLLQATGIEICVPFDKLNETMDQILVKIESMEKENERLMSPIGIRFTKDSPAYLSMMAKNPAAASVEYSAIIEIPTLIQPGDPSRFNNDVKALRKLQSWAIDQGHRLHWGLSFKSSQFNYAYAEKVFPEVAKWLAAYKKLNPHLVFSNSFTNQLGFDANNPITPLNCPDWDNARNDEKV